MRDLEPDQAQRPGAPVASTGDAVSGVAREVPSPKDEIDPEPPQQAEPGAVGREANVSAQTASVPPSDDTTNKTTKKKGS